MFLTMVSVGQSLLMVLLEAFLWRGTTLQLKIIIDCASYMRPSIKFFLYYWKRLVLLPSCMFFASKS